MSRQIDEARVLTLELARSDKHAGIITALVYLGDCIRDAGVGVADIGPALDTGLMQLAVNIGDLPQAVRDAAQEISR